jgi:hypothetical protein
LELDRSHRGGLIVQRRSDRQDDPTDDQGHDRPPAGRARRSRRPRLTWDREEAVQEEVETAPHVIQPMIDKGVPENEITNAVFAARNPKLAGQALRAGSKAARQWAAIRTEEVLGSHKHCR